MLIDSATSEIRTPAGCDVPKCFFGLLMRTRDIAPRWGATALRQFSINIAPRWGAPALRRNSA